MTNDATVVLAPTSGFVPHALLAQLAEIAAEQGTDEVTVTPSGLELTVAAASATLVAERLQAVLTAGPAAPAPVAPFIGWHDAPDGTVALGAGFAGGTIARRTLEFLVAIDRDVTVTPRRSIVIGALTESMAEQIVRVLAPMGLIFDATSPLLEQPDDAQP